MRHYLNDTKKSPLKNTAANSTYPKGGISRSKDTAYLAHAIAAQTHATPKLWQESNSTQNTYQISALFVN